MKQLFLVFTAFALWVSCDTATDRETDLESSDAQPVAITGDTSLEALFAKDLCKCLGVENMQTVRELTELIEEKGVKEAEMDSIFNKGFQVLNMSMFKCMAELSGRYEDWEGEENGEVLDEAIATHCPDLGKYMEVLQIASYSGPPVF